MYYSYYPNRQELVHYGVKGMRWGVRKKVDNITNADKAYRTKMKNISSNKNAHADDRKVAKFQSQSHTKKVATIVGKAIAEEVIKDAIKGDVAKYKDRSSKDWFEVGKNIAAKSAKEYVFNEAVGRSVASKYNSDGTSKSGKDNKYAIMTRETAATHAYAIGKATYPFASRVAGMKYSQMKYERQKNESKFKSWGGRIIEAPVYDNIVDLNRHEYRVK